MKKLLYLIIALIFTGCATSTEYNNNLEIPSANESLSINKPLQKAYIYVDKKDLNNQKIKPSTSLGKDELEINLGEYAQKASYRFFKAYLSNIELTNDKNILTSNDLIIIPTIDTFSYGFHSDDGFDVDGTPFVNHNLQIAMYKNGKQIYNKNIGSNQRVFGVKTFFGMGNTSYEQIGSIFQKSIAEKFNAHSVEIIQVINQQN